MRYVEVVPPNNNWSLLFNKEAEQIRLILQEEVHDIYHIGSTAIPNMSAKPVIDILVNVMNISNIDDYNQQFEKLDYIGMGENGIKDRRFFMKGRENRTHHIHIFQQGNKEIKRHLAFRDYLISHPKEAEKYRKLKEELAKQFPNNMKNYIEGKDSFIKNIDKLAADWYCNR
ncbi:GrpB family protein [Aquibacillus halophilus]|uniref:GrpB family protein n=1 Tax=Aquibacillus halophilus TaxID=930132 RepID=A0A6A8D815_9BACI|nr:GrpB family protein [Aquibacillus halophilus]